MLIKVIAAFKVFNVLLYRRLEKNKIRKYSLKKTEAFWHINGETAETRVSICSVADILSYVLFILNGKILNGNPRKLLWFFLSERKNSMKTSWNNVDFFSRKIEKNNWSGDFETL